MYSLQEEYSQPFRQWLEKNDFTDFAILKEAKDGQPEICAASAEINFFRTTG